ncbi:MAG: hypothetical protein HYS40_00875 [Gemmatimonadetes bacterium]|nr:hypothetical protein [Gemmatimonadota bacterium]
MNFARRHPLALALAGVVLAGALWSHPTIVDAVTGAVPGDTELTRPLLYTVLAPLSNVLDALTFLSLGRAQAALAVWAFALGAIGAARRGTPRLRVGRALLGPIGILAVASATVALPRPVPRLAVSDSSVTVLNYHAHTNASHDGRKGWTAEDLGEWHAAQGFSASYVTDHNVVFTRRLERPIPLLPGAEWSVYRQHIIALGPVREIDRERYQGDTPRMLGLFAELHRQGTLVIASLPEYWRNHRESLDAFVAAGVDGFEIVNCAPKAIGFAAPDRRDVIGLAARHDLLVTGASDNHGWGKVTCVWNVSVPGGHGFRANRVITRPIVLAQGDAPAWSAAVTQPWLMFRSLSWSERVSWLTWILVLSIYRSVPRRQGQRAGLGILARSITPGESPRAAGRPGVP